MEAADGLDFDRLDGELRELSLAAGPGGAEQSWSSVRNQLVDWEDSGQEV